MRTPEEWLKICDKITTGHKAGGNRRNTHRLGISVVDYLVETKIIEPGDHILDVGCANGRVPMGLATRDYPCTYDGVDVHKPCIDFCKYAFTGYPLYHFHHLDLRSTKYWPKGKTPQYKVIYPFEDGVFDSIVAISLFSHTGTYAAAERTLQEMSRVLKPDGILFSTWIFGETDRNDARTVYDRETIEGLFSKLHLSPEQRTWGAASQTVIALTKEDV